MAVLFIEWIFYRAPASFLRTVRDVSVGLFYYFSIPILFGSLFAPWRRDATPLENAPAGLWGQIILNNIISRIIGFFVRSVTILIGLFAILVWNLGVVIFFIGWYGLPFLLFASVLYGARLFIGI